jgi:hypothetical protein
LGRGLVKTGVGRENGATALPLVADNTTHGDCLEYSVSICVDRRIST